jgi:DNA modification methylase
MQIIEIPISEVVFRQDLYPRIKHDPMIIQKYADCIDQLPPIEINQHNILIDGYHRLTAHEKEKRETIKAIVIETKSEAELLTLAIEKNAKHGYQLSNEDKKKYSVKFFAMKSHTKEELIKLFSVSKRTMDRWLSDIEKQEREERKQKIFDMYLAGCTQEEIAENAGLSRESITKQMETLVNMDNWQKIPKNLALFEDEHFEPPLFNIWNWAKKTNEVSHFGNSEQRIVENLLYLYTKPFEIVIDPFAGGGSTVDVCKKRLRRYIVSDLNPIPERKTEIRQLDITNDLPSLNNRWSEVSLVYLDPPYWKQAEGKYSDDQNDLSNMPLDDFHNSVAHIINRFAEKMKTGNHIALLISPTQWKNEDKSFSDHMFEISKMVDLKVINRISCPYSTEQYNGTQVNIAKKEKLLLALTRELIIFQV